MGVRFKLFIQKSKKEEYPQFHHRHKILEERLLNGRYGIHIYKILRKKQRKIKREGKTIMHRRKQSNPEDTLRRS